MAYTERTAAYAVVLGDGGTVAAVRGPSGCYWLPGGGCLPGESAEEAIAREVREELGRGVRLIDPIGEAIQFFHAASEGCYYRMRATFFRAALTGTLNSVAERELLWLPTGEAAFFHECHGWAVDRALGRVEEREGLDVSESEHVSPRKAGD